MIYLSGKPDERRMAGQAQCGFLLSPRNAYVSLTRRCIWAADSDCFKAPEAFDSDRYLTWLERCERSRCLFAAAPDRLADAQATLEVAGAVLPRIRALGYRAALVAQDGLQALAVPWADFDALFIGGTTAWKLSRHAWALCGEAQARGKWVHMGRVNSFRRLDLADWWGCGSVDGTYLKWAPDKNKVRLEQWFKRLYLQPKLPLARAQSSC
jgi:hypothetical protein